MAKKLYDVSFHCYYPNGDMTRHTQTMELKEIAKWIDSYKYTHPACTSIAVKVWFNDN